MKVLFFLLFLGLLPINGLNLAYAADPISSIILLKDYIVINMDLKYWNFSYLPLQLQN